MQLTPVVALLLLATACLPVNKGANLSSSDSQRISTVPAHQSDDTVKATVSLLRTYCKACHTQKDNRFITSRDDQVVWNDLFTKKAPKLGVTWAEAIIATLKWPKKSITNSDHLTNGVRYMPIGGKRAKMMNDYVGRLPARTYIIRALEKGSGT